MEALMIIDAHWNIVYLSRWESCNVVSIYQENISSSNCSVTMKVVIFSAPIGSSYYSETMIRRAANNSNTQPWTFWKLFLGHWNKKPHGNLETCSLAHGCQLSSWPQFFCFLTLASVAPTHASSPTFVPHSDNKMHLCVLAAGWCLHQVADSGQLQVLSGFCWVLNSTKCRTLPCRPQKPTESARNNSQVQMCLKHFRFFSEIFHSCTKVSEATEDKLLKT